ncbi:hypothetical protein K492DRAFT_171116 [Lichtheimia hyalospora FSU 10163]|nr:hypothetical protein K492DRAFT_171116 [Lichtheimia hyalospora FSU 10163]
MVTTFSDNLSSPNVMLAMGHPASRQQCISANSSNSSDTEDTTDHRQQSEPSRWACHKHILSEHSPYFAAMFESEFYESDTSIVFLPLGVFSATGLDVALHFMYSQDLALDHHNKGAAELPTLEITHQLLEAYSAADYLGMEHLRQEIVDELSQLAHQWMCYCTECRDVVIQIVPYSEVRARRHHDMIMNNIHSRAVDILTSEPDRALATYFTSPRLIEVLAIYPDLSSQVISRITRFNAVETLYACFTVSDHVNDPALAITLDLARDHAIQMIATQFAFYCCQYPTLLSCIDGIKYSFEFVKYLFGWLLQPDMSVYHAPAIYQGIVRDLLSRHSVQQCSQTKTILSSAKQSIETFLVNNLDQVVASGALKQLDRGVLSKLIEERNIPIKRLGLESQTRIHSTTKHSRPRNNNNNNASKSSHEKRTTVGRLMHRQVTHLFDWLRPNNTSADKESSNIKKDDKKHALMDKHSKTTTPPTNKKKTPVGKRRILLVSKSVTSP